MKRMNYLLSVCLMMCLTITTTAHSQNVIDYRPLVDSLIRQHVLLNTDLSESALKLHETYVDIEPVNLEYGLYYCKQMQALIDNIVDKTVERVNTETDYQALVSFYKKSENESAIMNSQSVQRTLGRRMINKLAIAIAEFVESGYRTFELTPYEILDKEFETAFNDYWESSSKTTYETLFQTLMQASTGGANGMREQRMLNNFTESVKNAIPNYLCYTLMEYCTVEDLRNWQSNNQMDYLQQELSTSLLAFITQFTNNPKELMKDLLQTARGVTSMELATFFAKKHSKNILNVQRRSNVATISWGKGSYTGEIFNTLPHGKGTYTDKKGNRYTGDWMNGKRHGYITQHKLNGDTIRSLWAGDKILKGKEKIQDGFRGKFYKGKPFGFGILNDGGVISKGMFIDGLLHGEGYKVENDIEYDGVFEYGQFVRGTIKVKNNGNPIIVTGEFDNSITGTGTVVITSNTECIKSSGVFKNGVINGLGERVITTKKNDTIIYRGTFAYGDFMGRGSFLQKSGSKKPYISYTGLLHKTYFIDGEMHSVDYFPNNIQEYKGDCYYDRRHGKGSFSILNGNDTIVYNGDFKEGVFDGYGEYVSSIFAYKGEFKDGKIHGKGIATNASEQILDGSWEIGKPQPHSSCVVTFKNGNKLEGVVSNGYIVGTLTNKKGKVIRYNYSMNYEFNYTYLKK